MDKETLLKLVKDKVRELRKQIEERTDIIQRTGKRLEVQIDPYQIDYYGYLSRKENDLLRPFNRDKELGKLEEKLRQLREYIRFIENYCTNDNIHCFGLP
jgi:hypothetical protein